MMLLRHGLVETSVGSRNEVFSVYTGCAVAALGMMGLPLIVLGFVLVVDDGPSMPYAMAAFAGGGLLSAMAIRLSRSGAVVDRKQRVVVIRQIVATRRIDVDVIEELRFRRGLMVNSTLYVIRSDGKRPIAISGLGYSLAGVGRVEAYEVARRLAESIGSLRGRMPAVV